MLRMLREMCNTNVHRPERGQVKDKHAHSHAPLLMADQMMLRLVLAKATGKATADGHVGRCRSALGWAAKYIGEGMS
jgi:hypothetical protein